MTAQANRVQQIDDWDGTCAGVWQVTAADGLNIRETPGGKVLGTMRQHTIVYVWCASGAWYCVQTTDDINYITGWSHSNYLAPLAETSNRMLKRALSDEMVQAVFAATDRLCHN